MLDLASMAWTCTPQSGDIPASRAYHSSVVIFKYMYIFGGRAGSKYYNDVYRLYLDTMTWEKLSCTGVIPSPRSSCTANQYLNKIVLFGGMDGSKCYNDVFVLDTLTMKWSSSNAPSLPLPRHKHSSCSIGNSIYIIGMFGDFILIHYFM
jgi:N-acetylneuraminic acid mutarotase